MSDNYTPGQSSDKSIGEIKYLSIAKVSEGHLLLTLPTANTKKAYAEEVTSHHIHCWFIVPN
jgi:hypothetical protein